MVKHQNKTVIITHSEDPDGIISAAFIVDILESAGMTYELRFADYLNLAEVIEKAAKETGKSLYILDLNLSETEIPNEVMMPLLNNNEVHFFDHHETGLRRRKILRERSKICVLKSEKVCTARLIVEHYRLEDKESKVLSDCAQATDYDGTVGPKLTELGAELAKAIWTESGLELENIVQTIKRGRHKHEVWRNDYNLTGKLAEGADRTQKAMNTAMPQFENSASCHKLFRGTDSGIVVAVAMASNSLKILSGMYGYQLLKKKYPDAHVCFVLYESGSVFAGPGQSSEKSHVPLVKFLKKQKGGGRDNMGGFRYETTTNADNYEQRKESLILDLKSFLEQYSPT